MSTESTAPVTTAGVMVKTATGEIGITTDAARAKTPRIPVQFVGAPYPILMQVADLTRLAVQA